MTAIHDGTRGWAERLERASIQAGEFSGSCSWEVWKTLGERDGMVCNEIYTKNRSTTRFATTSGHRGTTPDVLEEN
jgi:hypothetical protein